MKRNNPDAQTKKEREIKDTLVDLQMREGYLIIEGEKIAFVVDFDRNQVTQMRPKMPRGYAPQETLISYHMKDYISEIKCDSATIRVDNRGKIITLTGPAVNTPFEI